MSGGLVTRDGGGQALGWFGGSVHRILLDGAATGGRVAAFRSTMVAGAASPVHLHAHDDETVFVLSGAMTVWCGDQRWELRSGDMAFLPRGLPHTYLITSDGAELLTLGNPAGMETLFRTAGWDLRQARPQDWDVDLTALATAARALGQHVLGPPLGPHETMPTSYLTLS